MTSPEPRLFVYQKIILNEAYWFVASPYFTAESIGKWLRLDGDYVETIQKITQIFPHINFFTKEIVINNRPKRVIKVYDPIAFYIIATESNKPQGIKFREMIGKLLFDYVKGRLVPLVYPTHERPSKRSQCPSNVRNADIFKKTIDFIKKCEESPCGQKVKEIKKFCKKNELKVSTFYAWRSRYRETGILEYRYVRSSEDSCEKKRIRLKKIAESLKKGFTIEETANILKCSVATVMRYKKIFISNPLAIAE